MTIHRRSLILFLGFIVAFFAGSPAALAADPATDPPAAPVADPAICSDDDYRATPFHVPDNDVYLLTREHYNIIKRYRAGDPRDPLPDFEVLLKSYGHLPSTHFWVAARHLLAVQMNRELDRDAIITREFEACLSRAKAAKSIAKLRHAGMFYGALCNAGLGSLNGLRGNWIKSGVHLRRSVKGFFDLLKERPNHHGTLFAVGVYNYYTSRAGTLGKLVLGLIGLPVGDRTEGLSQLRRASATDGPIDLPGKMMLADAYMTFEERKADAYALAEEIVRLAPENPQAHMTMAIYSLLTGRLANAQDSVGLATRCLPENARDSDNMEVRFNAYEADMLGALLGVLLDRSPEALRTLYGYCRPQKEYPISLNLWAVFVSGHLFALADQPKKAAACYQRVVDADVGPRWIRDRARRYLDDWDIARDIELDKVQKAALKVFLADKPLPPEK